MSNKDEKNTNEPLIGFDHQAKPAETPTGTVRVKGKGPLAEAAKRLNAEPDTTGTQIGESTQGQGGKATAAPGSAPASTKKPGDGAATTTETK